CDLNLNLDFATGFQKKSDQQAHSEAVLANTSTRQIFKKNGQVDDTAPANALRYVVFVFLYLTWLTFQSFSGAFTVTLANQTTTWFDRFLYWNTETLKEPRVAYAANHHQQWFNRTGPGYV